MERDLMEKKDCFGSIQELVVDGDMTMIQATFGCRDCQDFKECLQFAKERDELRKQNMIAKIIDLSEIHSNEIGSCLLECLNRIYGSPLGAALFRNLLLFYEIPEGSASFTVTIPISPPLMELIDGGEETITEEGFTLRIVLIQRLFPGNSKANMGLIAQEVARVISGDDLGVNQVLAMLSDSEAEKFKKMDVNFRASWLIRRWGFQSELEAFQKAMQSP
jgi:hypothetical protein